MNYQFVTIKVNMEKAGDGKMIKNKFGVKVYPTYLLINPDGTLYNKFIGGAYVTAFADKLKNALLGEEDEYIKKNAYRKETDIFLFPAGSFFRFSTKIF